jgi:hypothetical protein
MQPVLATLSVVVFLGIVLWIFQLAVRANSPANIRRALGAGFILAGVGLIYFRIFSLAYFLLFVGSALALSRRRRSTRPSPAGQSRVRSHHLEMTLDHDTGEMDGVILTGIFQERMLSELDLAELFQLRSSFADEAESIKLLETYLDHAHSDWREGADGDTDQPGNGSPISDDISRDEAYRILGLKPGASEDDIRQAHHRLIKRVHPDRGGTAALAAQINDARDRLLGDC